MFLLKRIVLLACFVSIFNSTVFASGIEASYGFGFATSSFQLNASEGEVDNTTYFSPIHLFYMAEMGSTSRLTVEFFNYNIKFESSPAQTLGVNALNSGMNFLYEEELKISASLTPIIGAGLSISKLTQSARHSTTPTGKLDTEYPGKEEFTGSIILSAGYDFGITDNMFVYARVLQSLALSSDLTETQFLISFMFRK